MMYTSERLLFFVFQAQRYEAASTIYGPHTLDIYLNKYAELTNDLVEVRPGVC